MRCLLLAVAQQSITDAETDSLSLIHLVEYVEAPRGAFPLDLPVQVHALLDIAPDEMNRPFECQLYVLPRTGTKVSMSSTPLEFTPASETHRVVFGGLLVPEPGVHEVSLGFRAAGTQQFRPFLQSWLLRVAEAKPIEPPPAKRTLRR